MTSGRFAVLLLAFLAGCATVDRPDEVPPPPPATPPDVVLVPAPPPVQVSQNIAVARLAEGARAESTQGEHAKAAASLERALRIEPRNPRLWQELARVRLQQRDYAQAESVATRSNSWAGSDNAVRAENWRIIAEARSARGDAAGARAALEQADRLR
jgi:cytochrome c-type biogenesis protein CcmH/NrfG